MEKWSRRILFGSGILAAGLAATAGVVHNATINRLAGIAFDRKCPDFPIGSRDRLRGSGPVEAVDTMLTEYGRLLRQTPSCTVRITARDGTPLVGHWIGATHPKRVILAMHGWRSSWDHDFGMVADFFRQEECSVLYIEQRGQNSSGGDYIGFGVLERFDCLDWLQWLEGNRGNLPVYLVGISMGATTVMLAAGLELPEFVHGIIADCGFTSIDAISHHVMKNNLGYPVSRGAIDRLCRKRLKTGAREVSTTQALANAKVPVLIVHGENDSFVPVSMAYENFRACGSEKTLLVVPMADHGMSYYLDPGTYEKTVRAFWNRIEEELP